MHDNPFDDAEEIQSNFSSAAPKDGQAVMLRTTQWIDLGHDDPRMPPAFVIAFSVAAFTTSAFEQHGVPFPATLQKAVPKRQAEFLMGRLAARHAIEHLGVAAAAPGIGTSREPLWQTGVTGSITHTKDMAGAIAVDSSTVHGIGIDIENVVDADARRALEALAITAEEQALLEARREHLSVDAILTIAFSAKESFFKGTFGTVGRYFDFSAARVTSLHVNSGRLTLTLEEDLAPALPKGCSFTVCFRMLTLDTVVTSFVW